MNSMMMAAIMLALTFALIAGIVLLSFMCVWWFVYHWFGCRRNPIKKAVLASLPVIWVTAGAIIALLS